MLSFQLVKEEIAKNDHSFLKNWTEFIYYLDPYYIDENIILDVEAAGEHSP